MTDATSTTNVRGAQRKDSKSRIVEVNDLIGLGFQYIFVVCRRVFPAAHKVQDSQTDGELKASNRMLNARHLSKMKPP
jgi:hypothetical protein